jgi:hypothetical protein
MFMAQFNQEHLSNTVLICGAQGCDSESIVVSWIQESTLSKCYCSTGALPTGLLLVVVLLSQGLGLQRSKQGRSYCCCDMRYCWVLHVLLLPLPAFNFGGPVSAIHQ